MLIEILELKYLKLLFVNLLAIGIANKQPKNTNVNFRCNCCDYELDIEDKLFSNICPICSTSLGYDNTFYWSNRNKLIVGNNK